MFSVMSFVIFSCSNDNDDNIQEAISVNPFTVQIDHEGGDVEILLHANTSWTAAPFGDTEWVTVSPAQGTSSDGKLVLTIEPNDAESPRSGEVRVFSQNTYAKIEIEQEAKPAKVLPAIAELRALYEDADAVVPADYVVKATVISDFRKSDDGGINNNSSAKNVVVSDGKSGIMLRLAEDNTEFALWDEVEIDLSGLTVTKYQGAMQVSNVPASAITKTGNNALEPVSITAADLLTNKYESMYVAINDVQVAASDLGKTYATSSSHGMVALVAKTGETFELFSSKYSVFRGETVPQGSGVLKGIAGININNSGIVKYQIILTSLADVADMTSPRFALAGDNVKSVADIRALYKGSNVKITDDLVIKGIVTSDFRRDADGGLNNYTSAKNLVIQDATGGIQLRLTADNKTIARGDSITVSLKDQTVSAFNGSLQIDNLSADNVSVINSGNALVAKEITAADLLTGKYESVYVAVKDVQISDADLSKTFVVGGNHTSISVVSKEGETFDIFSSKYAVFGGETVPQGSGVLKGIAGVNVVNGKATYQLVISAKSDYTALTGTRYASAPLFSLASKASSVSGDAGFVNIELAANVAWTAMASDPSAATLSVSSGNASTTVKLTYNDNPSSTDKRTIKVTFKTTSTEVSENELVYTLTQQPYELLVSDVVNAWMELPEVPAAAENFAYVSNHIDLSGSSVRNYSMWYDAQNRIASWVAYPLYSAIIGSGSRTEAFDYDPKVPERDQAVLFKSYGVSGYDRGHQLPSADRVSSDNANKTTFYFTNMTPQNSDLNQNVWAKLEGKVRDWAKACDTLYVVTGAVLKVNSTDEITYLKDNNGASVAVPKGYYKVLLRYNKSESTNGGYSAIGFWYENKAYGNVVPSASDIKSVREIETMTGFNFFKNLSTTISEVVENNKNGADWGIN